MRTHFRVVGLLMLMAVAACEADQEFADVELRPSESTPIPKPDVFAKPCQWPTAVVFDDRRCSGVLIHPSVVLTAGHCIGEGEGPEEIYFGESAFAPELSVATTTCARHPDGNGVVRHDYAYCLLAEPVDLAIVPPALGCELDWIELGQAFVTVGSGLHGTSGRPKFKFVTAFLGWHEGMIGASMSPYELCPGDSGGPSFLRLRDGSWRLVGLSAGGPSADHEPDCIDPALIVPASEAVAWIEEQTGIDVSPCHLADGTWAPGPDCTGFAVDPLVSIGEHPWVDGTCADPRSGPIGTCGPSFAASEESEPPIVEIVTPIGESHHPGATAFDVTVDAQDLDGDGMSEGVAVLAVELLVDGEVVALESIDYPLEQPSVWRFPGIELAAGEHELGATATDYWGNVGVAEPVTIHVDDEPEPGSADDAQTGGCTLAPRRDGMAALAMLMLLGMGLRQGRRRGVS